MKKFGLILILAVAFAVAASLGFGKHPLDAQLASVRLAQLQDLDPTLRQQPATVQSVLVTYAANKPLYFQAQAALTERPELARAILPVYGASPAFQKVLVAYGTSVLIPIDYFTHHDIYTLLPGHYASKWYAQLFSPDDATEPEADKLTPTDRGWRAVGLIESKGHRFLSEFVTAPDGSSEWLYTTRGINDLTSLFTSGITNLERKHRDGQGVDLGDFAWAAVDVVPFLAAGHVLKAGKVAKAGVTETKAVAKDAKLVTKEAGTATKATLVSKVGRGAEVTSTTLFKSLLRHPFITFSVAGTTLAITHPSLISAGLTSLAHLAGLPVWLVQLVGWFLILLPLLYVVTWLLRVLAPILEYTARAIGASIRWIDHRTSGKGEVRT